MVPICGKGMARMHAYRAFGMTLSSEIPLPALMPAGLDEPDVEIALGSVNADGLPGALPLGRFAQATENQLWLHVPGVARFLISDGRRILIDPENGSDEQSIRLYALGSCIGAIVHQRGDLILHGCALRFGDRCAVIAGHSGAGKSTLSAALNLRGHDLISDDLAVLDRQGLVHPGFPQIKLWADTARMLGLDIAAMRRIRLQVDKYAYRVEHAFCNRPMPLAAVYILHTHNQAYTSFEAVTGMAKLAPLQAHTYRPQQIKGMKMQPRHLQACSRLANRINLTHITRPMAGASLDEMMERVEADMQPSLIPA